MQNIRIEEAEYRAEENAKEQALQDYRTGEKNAVAIAQAYQAQMALEAQRAGEREVVEVKNTGSGKPLAMPVPVENRVTDKEREAAMQSYREGERNAVSIAEEYKSQVREEANQSYHEGERDAVAIAEDYKARVREEANSSYREGERNAIGAVREYATQSHHEGERTAFLDPNLVCEPGSTKEEPITGNVLDEIKGKFLDYVIAIRQFDILSKISINNNEAGNKSVSLDVPDGQKRKFSEYLSSEFGLNFPERTGNLTPQTINKTISDAIFNTEGKTGLKGFVTGMKNYGLDIVENTKAFGNNMIEYGKDIFDNISGKFTSSKVTSITDDIAEATLKTVTKEGTQSLAKEVMESAIKSGPLDVLTTIGFNAYDYGLGENKDKKIISQEFAVSVGVDLVQSVVAGLAAALLVAGVVALLPVLAPAIVVSAPIVLGITAGTAMLIDIGLNLTYNEKIKKAINNYLDS